MSLFVWALSAPNSACAQGVLIGHPVSSLIAEGDGITFTSAVLPVDRVRFEPCTSAPVETVVVDADLDLIAGSDLPMAVGTWCAMQIVPGDPLQSSGVGDAGGTFTATLAVDPIDIVFASAITVTVSGSTGPQSLEIATEDWLTASSLGLAPSTHVSVLSSHALHDGLCDSIEGESTIE